MSNIITTTGRGIADITVEIRTIVRQTQQIILRNAMEIGRRLIEAKELVPHGEWGAYLEREVEFSQSTANNMMQLYREYGGDGGLFAPNSQAFETLPYTKALRLLAVPAEEREEFAKAVDAEHASVRELEQAIKERDAAKELSAAAQERFEAERNEVEKLVGQLAQAKTDREKAEKEQKKLAKKLKKAEAAEEKAKKEAEDAKASKAQIPDSVMEQLRKDAEAAAAEKNRETIKELADRANAKNKAAEEKVRQMEAKLEAARREQQMSDGDMAVFKLIFGQVQEDFNKLTGSLIKIKGKDEATADKLTQAVRALIKKVEAQL